MVKSIERPMPILLLSIFNLNCFYLLISYGDYKKRLFPFLKFKNDQDEKVSSPHVKSKVSKIYETSKGFRFNRNKHYKRKERIKLQKVINVSKNISNDLAKILHQSM